MTNLNIRKTKDCIEYLTKMEKACQKDVKRTLNEKRKEKLRALSKDINTFVKELKSWDEKKLSIEQCEKVASLSGRGLLLAGVGKKEGDREDD